MKNNNGKKYTILWNVDDLKFSHVDSDIASRVRANTDTEYGRKSEN